MIKFREVILRIGAILFIVIDSLSQEIPKYKVSLLGGIQ